MYTAYSFSPSFTHLLFYSVEFAILLLVSASGLPWAFVQLQSRSMPYRLSPRGVPA